jgi:hypothetical protein
MAQMSPPLLTVSVIAVLIPSAFIMALGGLDTTSIDQSVLEMSRGVCPRPSGVN